MNFVAKATVAMVTKIKVRKMATNGIKFKLLLKEITAYLSYKILNYLYMESTFKLLKHIGRQSKI